MPQYGWPDAPAGVKEQVEALLAGFRNTLGGNLRGLYLHGSLAMGCFNPLRSDIDLLAVTRQRISVEQKRDLAALLLEISMDPSPLEISSMPDAYLDPWEHPARYDLHYSEDHRAAFTEALIKGTWQHWNESVPRDEDLAAHITLTRASGVSLYGPAPGEIFPPVPENDFLDSLLGDVLSEKFGMTPDTEIPVYMVLNACRTLAYLQTKRILSKAEG